MTALHKSPHYGAASNFMNLRRVMSSTFRSSSKDVIECHEEKEELWKALSCECQTNSVPWRSWENCPQHRTSTVFRLKNVKSEALLNPMKKPPECTHWNSKLPNFWRTKVANMAKNRIWKKLPKWQESESWFQKMILKAWHSWKLQFERPKVSLKIWSLQK